MNVPRAGKTAKAQNTPKALPAAPVDQTLKAPRTPKTLKAPKAPKTPNALEVPPATEALRTPKALKTLKTPATPAAPKAARAPETSEAPEAPPVLKAPKAPPAPKAPQAPQALKAPKPPKAPKAPKAPQALHVLMVASEATPFSKTGGLADVATSLSRALGRLGHQVTLVTPRYRGVSDGEPRDMVRANVAGYWFEARMLEVPLGPGAKALLVDCPPLYDRPGLYTEANTDYPDNALRFAFLSIAALEWAAMQSLAPSLVHAHDWQAGLAPLYFRRFFARIRAGQPTAHGPQATVPTVFTIHNLAYQGIFDKTWLPRLGIGWEDFTVDGVEYWDRVSFLKAGVNFSDAITTVSPAYAEEIQRPEYGYGLEGVIRNRRHALTGILNGIDVEEWDPARDPYLPAPYNADDLSGKLAAKRALLHTFGLPTDDAAMGRPVVGMVSRLVEQKGLALIEAVARHLGALDATFTIVGSGDLLYENMWRTLAAAYPDRIAAFIGFDERRAHLVEAGADIFLMPSRFEPCGLNQMYSLRYGTVPVVRAVGGLVDTVRPYNPRNGQGNGFLFSEYDPTAMLVALARALETYRQPRVWQRLQTAGMRKDFSWEHSAAEYVKVYKRVMAARRQQASGVVAGA